MITLKTLPQATKQEVFDQVVNHLLTQMARSYAEDDESGLSCMYRNDRGLKCAAGCLIAGDEYCQDFEFNNWRDLHNKDKVPGGHMDLVMELQLIHDRDVPSEWERELIKLAAQEGLAWNYKKQKKMNNMQHNGITFVPARDQLPQAGDIIVSNNDITEVRADTDMLQGNIYSSLDLTNSTLWRPIDPSVQIIIKNPWSGPTIANPEPFTPPAVSESLIFIDNANLQTDPLSTYHLH